MRRNTTDISFGNKNLNSDDTCVAGCDGAGVDCGGLHH